MQSLNNNAGIHCKVSCKDQFRRFLFNGTEFSSLFKQVQQTLALNEEFVLKYKDTDGDLITLSSDEELACALNYSDGNILRLTAITLDDKDDETVTDPDTPFTHPYHAHFSGRRGCGKHYGGHHHGGHPHGPHGHHHGEHPYGPHGHHGGHGGHPHHKWGCELKKAKLLSKKEFFKSLLDDLEKVPEKTPEQERQIASLQKKLKNVESRLEGGLEEREKGGKHRAKWAAKAEKRRQKDEKKMQKRENKSARPVLSEETRAQIALLKSQIDVHKPGMKEVKNQMKSKKAALKESKATGGDPHQLLKEISDLKEKKNVLRSQVKPLKDKIRELKYASY